MPDTSPSAAAIPSSEFWQALSCRAVGAAVVTTTDDGAPAGFFALSVTHLTHNPPTIMFSVSESTSALAGLRSSGHVAINYLDRSQERISEIFSGKHGLSGADRFEAGLWDSLTTGAPALKDAVGTIDCRVEELIEREGTFIVLAQVLQYRTRADGVPLVHFSGRFMPLVL